MRIELIGISSDVNSEPFTAHNISHPLYIHIHCLANMYIVWKRYQQDTQHWKHGKMTWQLWSHLDCVCYSDGCQCNSTIALDSFVNACFHTKVMEMYMFCDFRMSKYQPYNIWYKYRGFRIHRGLCGRLIVASSLWQHNYGYSNYVYVQLVLVQRRTHYSLESLRFRHWNRKA